MISFIFVNNKRNIFSLCTLSNKFQLTTSSGLTSISRTSLWSEYISSTGKMGVEEKNEKKRKLAANKLTEYLYGKSLAGVLLTLKNTYRIFPAKIFIDHIVVHTASVNNRHLHIVDTSMTEFFVVVISRGGTPQNSQWGCAPGSSNPDPISDQNMSFSTPVFRPGL